MNETNFSGSSDSPEKPPVALLPAESSTTLTGELDGKAAGGTFSLEPMQEEAEPKTYYTGTGSLDLRLATVWT